MKEGTKKRLLLVDDDPNLRMMLGDFLVMNGYEVELASSGEAALKSMIEILPDMVILDMGMPGMGGTGFLERITDKLGRTRVPVLVLTARSAMAEFFADKQIAGFLTKPADPDELLEEVQRIIFMAADLPQGDSLIAEETLTKKLIVLAEPSPVLSEILRGELLQLGFSVELVKSGNEALETVIARHPDGIVMRLSLDGMCADEILSVLRKLTGTVTTPAVVYAIAKEPVMPDRIANIDTTHTQFVETDRPEAIIPLILKTIA